MGLVDKLQKDDLATGRKKTIMWVVVGLVGLLFFLYILFYYLLPMWRGPV